MAARIAEPVGTETALKGTAYAGLALPVMRYRSLVMVLTGLASSVVAAQAEVPANVSCASLAQQTARYGGAEYRQIYDRTYELCMVNAMPKDRQTDYFIEKLRPYVAISAGLPTKSDGSPSLFLKSERPKTPATWIHVSPNVWVLRRK